MQLGYSRAPIAIALSLALGGTFNVAAQTTNDLQDIEIIEVHGKVSDADQIVKQSELKQLQANDLADIFRSQSEISVGGANPVAQKIYVRGLEDTMLNVTVDGALQAGYLFHHQGRLTIEPELLKQVDIVAGAGDATSGSGALGGAIRFKTKTAHDLITGSERGGALVKLGYYGNSSGYKASTSVYGLINDDISGILSLIKRDTDNMHDGHGNELMYTASEQEVGFAKVDATFAHFHTFSLSHDVRHDDGTRLLRAHWQPSRKNITLEQQSQRTTNTINYSYQPNSPWLDIATTIYETDNSISHAHPLKGEKQSTYYALYNSKGLDLKNTTHINSHKLVAGVDFRNDTATLEDLGTQYLLEGREKGQVYGVYIQDYVKLGDALQVSAGVRYDHYELIDDNNATLTSSGLSPNLNISYQFSDTFSLNTGYAQAIRGQKVKELFVLGYYDNDVNMTKEVAQNYEVGFKYLGDKLTLKGDLFQSSIKDAVATAKNFDGIQQNFLTNVGEVQNKGFNVSAKYDFDLFSVSLAYNQSKPVWKKHINPALVGAAISDQDWSIGTSVGNTLTTALHYHFTDSLELVWQGRFVAGLKNTGVDVWTNATLPEKPGYAVHDLKATWHILKDESLSLDVAVKNLFDKFYYDHATYAPLGAIDAGIAEPGRDIRATLSWRY